MEVDGAVAEANPEQQVRLALAEAAGHERAVAGLQRGPVDRGDDLGREHQAEQRGGVFGLGERVTEQFVVGYARHGDSRWVRVR